MQQLPVLYQILIWGVPVLFAITLHEVGHGWAAKMLGDPTAKEMGRLSLNPIKHIDPVGTVLVPLTIYFTSGFIFGWAKPVPVNWYRLNNKKRDMALVALAGPGANLLMIIFWAMVGRFSLGLGTGSTIAGMLEWMSIIGIIINGLLMLLNLFPLPPLDGSRVMYSLLPDKLAHQYSRLEPFGIIILFVLLSLFIYFGLNERLFDVLPYVLNIII